jgi:hypothetical protein
MESMDEQKEEDPSMMMPSMTMGGRKRARSMGRRMGRSMSSQMM